MKFLKSDSLKISLRDEQYKEISDIKDIEGLIKKYENVIAFDIYHNNDLIGFSMLKEFEKRSYFLWNYAIDKNYQNKGLGTLALKELILFLKEKYNANLITTTYLLENNCAKHVYEKVGFKVVNVVDEEGCKEVDMEYEIV